MRSNIFSLKTTYSYLIDRIQNLPEIYINWIFAYANDLANHILANIV